MLNPILISVALCILAVAAVISTKIVVKSYPLNDVAAGEYVISVCLISIFVCRWLEFLKQTDPNRSLERMNKVERFFLSILNLLLRRLLSDWQHCKRGFTRKFNVSVPAVVFA